MIDNFKQIEQFMQFDSDSFYKFEALIRNTDGENPLWYDGISNSNKNILIKNWYVNSQEYYDRIKHEMRVLCDLTGARLYVTLDRKSQSKLLRVILQNVTELVLASLQGDAIGIKKLNKILASTTSLIDTTCKGHRTIMFDVDSADVRYLYLVSAYIESHTDNYFILPTKQGYHVFCFKTFNSSNWAKSMLRWIEDKPEYSDITEQGIENNISMKPNQLGLVYHPEREFTNA